jgi:hypothetical protein
MTSRELSDDGGMVVPSLRAVADYLRVAGWSLEDQDQRTSLWRPESAEDSDSLVIVLPVRQEAGDYADRIAAAIRVLAFAEQRLPEEITSDIRFGGADTVAVRMTPDAPSGEAPLTLVHSAVTALRDFVVGSAAAIEIHDLVLPSHRPQWAESYAGKVRLSTHSGSFILNLALPLVVDLGESAADDEDSEQLSFALPPQPFGRRVSSRMLQAAQAARQLADEVSAGNLPLRAFGETQAKLAANATELSALKALGGPEYGLYQLRFTQSPLAGRRSEPVSLRITPGQQRILGEAADFLRTRQPRSGVTVQGLVVRLHRSSAYGPGDVVVEGIDDDSGTTRRYRMELTAGDYIDALRAHRNGLQVSVTGDREERGTHLHLRRLTSFSVIPGLEYEGESDLPEGWASGIESLQDSMSGSAETTRKRAAWLTRGGEAGEREERALAEGLVFIGWAELADITGCTGRVDLREAVREGYPGISEKIVGNWTGQLWRFTQQMQLGDLVVMPLHTNPGRVAIGRITGPYEYRAAEDLGFRHVRRVTWMRTDVPRESFQPDLRNSIGSLLTVCELARNNAASRIQQLAETGTDPGTDGSEEITSSEELLADAISRDPADPRKLTIRNLLLHWGRTRRTNSAVSTIADDLAKVGLTTRPLFTDGDMEDEIEIVPVTERGESRHV